VSARRFSPTPVRTSFLAGDSVLPVAVQNVDEKSYGVGVDGLLGMSFLSRFEVQMVDGFIEVRTRGRKK
jgi:hypothetical protein